MKLQKIVSRLQELHPKEIDLSLDRIQNLCQRLGNPQDKLKAISIVGTNGKYSTIQAMFAILNEANIKCNIYTSPHIKSINERFVFNNQELNDEELANLFEEIESANNNEPITFFEILTAAYFLKASQYPNNINLIETGLFHRFDATNILKKNLASIVTSIGLDHLDWLPENEQTVEKIIYEKTSTLLNSNIIVAKQSSKKITDSIKKTISNNSSSKFFHNENYSFIMKENDFFYYEDQLGGIKLPLPNVKGQFQLENISTAIATLRTIKDFDIKDYYAPKPYYPPDIPPEVKFAEGGRIGFAGGGMGRRAFLKLLASIGGGVAAAKSGILGLGKGGGKQITKEVAKKVATGSGTVPPYFLNLVKKIKNLGDETLASQDKAIAKKYKDYVMEEDFAGNIEIIKKGDDVAGNKTEDVYMSLKVDEVPLKGKKGSAKVEEYEEFTARPDGEGKMKDVEPGVPDEVVQEGTMFEDTITEFGKAEGGRIGFSAGSLAKLGITGSSRRFLEKIFGKGSLDEMIKRDPEMHRGLLEVTEMFRKRDKEGLKAYMKNFLPHMDDTQIEEFIVGDAVDSAGQAKFGLGDMQGQLIRLGSGRDYKAKIEAIKKLEDAQKLDTLDVTEEMIRKPNAFGGIQTMLGE